MKIEKVFEYPVKHVGGVAFDGRNVWFSDPTNNALARVDRKTGKVIDRLKGPKVGSGTAWDGTHLWQVGDGAIQRVDPDTGRVVHTVPLPDKGFISGLAWDGEALWAGAFEQRKLYKIHPRSGKVLKVLNSDRFVTGITWIGDELWHAVYPEKGRPTQIRRLNPQSGRVLKRVKMPCTISGMAYDGASLWCGDCDTAKLRSVRIEKKPARRKATRSRRSHAHAQ